PHIVRNKFEADRILAMETKRMDWVIGDVMKIHATTGMEPVLSNYDQFAPGAYQGLPFAHPQSGMQSKKSSNPLPNGPNAGSGVQPASAKSVNLSSPDSRPPATVITQIKAPQEPMDPMNSSVTGPPGTTGSAGADGTDAAAPTDQGKESSRWSLFRNRK